MILPEEASSSSGLKNNFVWGFPFYDLRVTNFKNHYTFLLIFSFALSWKGKQLSSVLTGLIIDIAGGSWHPCVYV